MGLSVLTSQQTRVARAAKEVVALPLWPCPPTGQGVSTRGEADVEPAEPLSPCRGVSRSRPTSWRWGSCPPTFVDCVSRGSGDFFRAIRAGHSNNMTCRTSMGGGIVLLSSRTPGGSNILSLFLVREGVSGLFQAQALEGLLCLDPRPLLCG